MFIIIIMGYLLIRQLKLQRIQNAAACLVSQVSHFPHIIPVLADLHWLPVRYLEYLFLPLKLSMDPAHTYVSDLVTIKKLGARTNSPLLLQNNVTVCRLLLETDQGPIFKKQLKTYFYRKACNIVNSMAYRYKHFMLICALQMYYYTVLLYGYTTVIIHYCTVDNMYILYMHTVYIYILFSLFPSRIFSD